MTEQRKPTHRWVKWPSFLGGPAGERKRFCIYCGTVETEHAPHGPQWSGNYPYHSYVRGGVSLGILRKVPPCHAEFVEAEIDGWKMSLTPPPPGFVRKKTSRSRATEVHVYQEKTDNV